jgi:NAD(P)-dependent dehydrogenase (short-subunit alcohol dehydrogenase family)
VEADPVPGAVRRAQVRPERRLTVGTRRHQVEPPARTEDAAEESSRDVPALIFERDLSVELAPHGIRAVGPRPQAMPATRTIREACEPRAAASGMTWEQWQETLAGRNHARRLMTFEEMANVAAFLASDLASGMTGTTVNLTMGSLDD